MIYSDKFGDYIEAKAFVENGTKPTTLDAEFNAYCIARKNEFGPYHCAPNFDLERDFMTEKGYTSALVNNTYNNESDLDANIRYQVWTHKSVKIYDVIFINDDVTDDGLPAMVVSIGYNYSDPRGGYSGPELKIPYFSGGDYSAPADLVIGYHFTAADKNNADAVSHADALNDSGEYQVGYYGSPYYHLESDADSLERDEAGKITVVFDGHVLIAHPEYPYA